MFTQDVVEKLLEKSRGDKTMKKQWKAYFFSVQLFWNQSKEMRKEKTHASKQ